MIMLIRSFLDEIVRQYLLGLGLGGRGVIHHCLARFDIMSLHDIHGHDGLAGFATTGGGPGGRPPGRRPIIIVSVSFSRFATSSATPPACISASLARFGIVSVIIIVSSSRPPIIIIIRYDVVSLARLIATSAVIVMILARFSTDRRGPGGRIIVFVENVIGIGAGIPIFIRIMNNISSSLARFAAAAIFGRFGPVFMDHRLFRNFHQAVNHVGRTRGGHLRIIGRSDCINSNDCIGGERRGHCRTRSRFSSSLARFTTTVIIMLGMMSILTGTMVMFGMLLLCSSCSCCCFTRLVTAELTCIVLIVLLKPQNMLF
mmetsp:Transcript_20453/g.36370  ORF Transcript_20453/g.36370 Transcript_20453/m.36370 type:complete len:316 (+) Transcript_20453:39-986(+)